MAGIENLHLRDVEVFQTEGQNLHYKAEMYEKGLHLATVEYKSTAGLRVTKQYLNTHTFELRIKNLYKSLLQAAEERANEGILKLFKKHEHIGSIFEDIGAHLYLLHKVEVEAMTFTNSSERKQDCFTLALLVGTTLDEEMLLAENMRVINVNMPKNADIYAFIEENKANLASMANQVGVANPIIRGIAVMDEPSSLPSLTCKEYFDFLDYISLRHTSDISAF